MRRAARVDNNQGAIVEALRKAGISVVSLASLGRGVPDILAASGTDAWLIEIKSPKGKLTAHQVDWILNWPGVVHIVRTPDEALQLVGVI
jgi:Holliday junction resolvase